MLPLSPYSSIKSIGQINLLENTVQEEPNITFDDFTNFLRSGCFIRWQDEWYLFWNLGLRQQINSEDFEKSSEFPDGVYSCDFISGTVYNQFFLKTVKLSAPFFKEFLFKYICYNNYQKELRNRFFEPDWFKIDKDLFKETFLKIKEAILHGKVKKVVPIAFQYGKTNTHSKIDNLQKILFISKLLESENNLIPYGEWEAAKGFVGLTPELFFYIDGNRFATMALAGTSIKGTAKQDFLSDEKERKEHEMVIHDIKEKLEIFGTCQVGETYVSEFPHLNHLKTDIQVNLSDKSHFLEILERLHPTSALGIYPKSEYWNDFIQLPNQSTRQGFGAPWGFKIKNQSLFVVSIRRLQWEGNRLCIPAGCGIIELSDFEKEFSEIERKMNSVKKVFESKPSLREIMIHE